MAMKTLFSPRLFPSLLVALLGASACGGSSANIMIGTMPQGRTYQGVWQSPQYGNMHLCVTGSQVFGDFEKDERRGQIQGTIQGDVLRFQWEESREMVVGRPTVTRGRGYFKLFIDENEDSRVEGEWGLDNDETGAPWGAVLMRRRQPERCLNRGSGDDDGGGNGFNDYDNDNSYDDGGGSTYDDGSSSGAEDDLSGLDEI